MPPEYCGEIYIYASACESLEFLRGYLRAKLPQLQCTLHEPASDAAVCEWYMKVEPGCEPETIALLRGIDLIESACPRDLRQERRWKELEAIIERLEELKDHAESDEYEARLRAILNGPGGI